MKEMFIIIVLIFSHLIGISQNNLVGKKAPDIEIKNWIYPKIQVEDWQVKEVPIDLKGKIILLDFWFTKCAPCVASIPKLNHLAKHFPEITFLSVTFDEPEEIDRFLDKMVMYYPVGSDPEKKIISAYGVYTYPETFLIDENGIVIWQGSPFDLDGNFINSILGGDIELIGRNLNNSEIPYQNSAYSFSIQKHNLEMSQASYSHFNPYDINVFNKDIENMLKVFYGINKSRIISKDSTLLKTSYDLTLTADKDITTQANCVEMLKYLLPKQMGFELQEIIKDTIVDLLLVGNDSLLNSHNSNSQYYGTAIRYGNWESKGATIENLKDFLEDNYLKLISINKADNRKFDFTIPLEDFEVAKETLENNYGIVLKTKTQKTQLWEIINNNEE